MDGSIIEVISFSDAQKPEYYLMHVGGLPGVQFSSPFGCGASGLTSPDTTTPGAMLFIQESLSPSSNVTNVPPPHSIEGNGAREVIPIRR